MKKMLTLIASVAMAVALTGCGDSKQSAEKQEEKKAQEAVGSPKAVAEDFAKAIVQREPDKAFEFYDTVVMGGQSYKGSYVLRTKKQKNDLKEQLEDLGKKINDDKYDCKAILEQVEVASEVMGYMLVNGKKYTGENAKVLVQFMKGDDKKSDGLEVTLVKVDGSWKVAGYEMVSGLDTSSEDSDREVNRKVTRRKSRNFDGDSEFDGDFKSNAFAATNKVARAENVKSPYAAGDRVRTYERLCREYVSLLREKGREIPEEAIEEEVEKFRGYSSEKQEDEIEKAERELRKMRRSADDKKVEAKAEGTSRWKTNSTHEAW